MTETNNAYYQNNVELHLDVFDEKIEELKQLATLITAESKASNSVLFDIAKTPNINYWYYQVSKELKEKYHNHGVSNLGIYYFGLDKIISESGAMTSLEYLARVSPEDKDFQQEMAYIFDENQYENSGTLIVTLPSLENNKGNLYVGFYSQLGRKREKALILYCISESDVEQFFGPIGTYNGLDYYIVDFSKKHVCFCWGENGDVDAVNSYLKGDTQHVKSEHTLFWEKESKWGELALIANLNDSSPYNISRTFFFEILTLVMISLAVVMVCFVIAVFVIYKPVYLLISKLEYTNKGEFEMIENVLVDRKVKIEEQETLIQELQHRMQKLFSSKFFLFDGNEEKNSVLIFFLEKENKTEARECLLGTLKNEDITLENLSNGEVVHDLENIHESLQNLLKELKKKKESLTKDVDRVEREKVSLEKKQHQLNEKVLKYIEENYTNPNLSQAEVTDFLGESDYAISRIFKKQNGMGFAEYVNGKRVEYAKELLLKTDETVYEIAIKTGFRNDKNFFKVFKSIVGDSPTAYRKNNKVNNQT